MNAVFVLLYAYFGACLASFALVAAQRTLEDKKWWGTERSQCASCGRTLNAAELLPIFSYILLKGKCRSCKAPIPKECFVSELLGAACGAFFAVRFGFSYAAAVCFTAFVFLFFSAYTDLKSGYVYDGWAFASAAAGLAVRLMSKNTGMLAYGVYGAVFGFSLMFVLYLASRRKGMGLGDAYFMLGYGALFGLKMTLLGLYCAFLTGGCLACVLLIAKKVTRKTAMPLVPFLAIGALFALIIYPAVFAWFGIAADMPFQDKII